MPSGAVESHFAAIMAEECRWVLSRSWNTDIPLVFSHVVLTKTLGVRRAKDIRARITRRMYLWKKGLHAGLVGDAEAEGDMRVPSVENFTCTAFEKYGEVP